MKCHLRRGRKSISRGSQLFRLQLHQDSSYTSHVPGDGRWRHRSFVERGVGETCVIELSGLAAPSLKESKGTGLYLQERIEFIRRKIRDHRPKVVIMYGKAQKDSWERIAGGTFPAEPTPCPESRGFLFGEVQGVTVTVTPNGLINIPAVRTYHPPEYPTPVIAAACAGELWVRQKGRDDANPQLAKTRKTGHLGPIVDHDLRCRNKVCACNSETKKFDGGGSGVDSTRIRCDVYDRLYTKHRVRFGLCSPSKFDRSDAGCNAGLLGL